VEWRKASGEGTIYTFSVMRRVEEPCMIAHVTLAEGQTMLTNIVACDTDDVRRGHCCISRHRQRSASADVQAGLASFSGLKADGAPSWTERKMAACSTCSSNLC
jgi:hypothetical protein